MGSKEGMPAETVAPPGGGLRKEQVVGGGDGAAGKQGGGIASQIRLATANQIYIYRARRANSKVDLLTSVHQELFLLVDLDKDMINKRTEIGMPLSLHNLVPRCTQNGSQERRKRRAQAGSPAVTHYVNLFVQTNQVRRAATRPPTPEGAFLASFRT